MEARVQGQVGRGCLAWLVNGMICFAAIAKRHGEQAVASLESSTGRVSGLNVNSEERGPELPTLTACTSGNRPSQERRHHLQQDIELGKKAVDMFI